jgi:AraC family transcriptional regulator
MPANMTWQKLLADAPQRSDPLKSALAHKRENGAAGSASADRVMETSGIRISDIVCTSGPRDRPFEEAHPLAAIAIVLSGTFSYRGDRGRVLLTPGSLLMGNAGRCFCCGHEYGEGDRCLAFFYEPELLERIAADAGVRDTSFPTHRLPFIRSTAPLVAQAAAGLKRPDVLEEVALGLAGTVLCAQQDSRAPKSMARDERRVAEIVRDMEATLDHPHSLLALARQAGLSPYHFLRVFRKVTGVSPHQLLLRMRLNAAARRLRETADPVTEIAYGVGFEDLSNFVRSFRAEFGASPSRYRDC